jgi:hypothetical protein
MVDPAVKPPLIYRGQGILPKIFVDDWGISSLVAQSPNHPLRRIAKISKI